MKRYQIVLTLVMLLLVVFVCTDTAWAGPGGKIASAAFRSFWGNALLAVLLVIFFPFILYYWLRQALAVRRTRRDLRALAAVSDQFDWLTLKERISDGYHRVHAAWRKEDMVEASDWMTSWYWQNQQLVFLDQWERDGLVNHCRVKKINSIKPLFVRYKNNSGDISGSRLVVSIAANMEDYLANRVTGKVVEGKKGYTDVETVWTFIHENGLWLVANIEQDAMTMEYCKLANEVPEWLTIPGGKPATA